MARSFSDVSQAIASAYGARAAWMLPARHVPDAIAKLGLIGPGDRLVVFADDFAEAFTPRFPASALSFADNPSPEAFLAASGHAEKAAVTGAIPAAAESSETIGSSAAAASPSVAGSSAVAASPSVAGASAAEAPSGTVARLAAEPLDDVTPDHPVHHASYAHGAGACFERLFWFVSSIGGFDLRVPDLRALARAAASAGAILIVDNTVPSSFGCQPLTLGAPIVFEALDRVAAGGLSRKVVALAVAPSSVGKGRRRRVNPLAEDAYRLLAMRLSSSPAASGGAVTSTVLSPADLAAIDAGLSSLAQRMQVHMDNARAIAEFLACHPAVDAVSYPGLKSHPDHAVAANDLMHGYGPAIDFHLSAPLRARSVIAACGPAVRESTAGGPATRMSAAKGDEARFIRLFAGTDDPLDIVDSLDQALRMFCNPPQP